MPSVVLFAYVVFSKIIGDSRDGSYCGLARQCDPIALKLLRTTPEFGSTDLVRDPHIRLAFGIRAPHNWLILGV